MALPTTLQNFKIEVTLDIKLSDANVKSQISKWHGRRYRGCLWGALLVEIAFVNTPTNETLNFEVSWG